VQASRGSLSPDPIHLQPTASLAERVLLPGDPARALVLAGLLLDKPLMFNHHRGLWGYTGRAPDGHSLTIQSTGMGGPSAAIVISELADLGVGTLIRVGTCRALRPELGLGDLVAVTRAVPFDGTGTALADGAPLVPDPSLLGGLRSATAGRDHAGPVASTDLFYEIPESERDRWVLGGALAVDLQTATLFALARRRALRTASLLLVSDVLGPERVHIDPDALQDGERRLGETAMRALDGG
jgi:uridine phosphorylase